MKSATTSRSSSGGTIVALWDQARLAEDPGVVDGGGWGGVMFAHNVGSPEEVVLGEDGLIESLG